MPSGLTGVVASGVVPMVPSGAMAPSVAGAVAVVSAPVAAASPAISSSAGVQAATASAPNAAAVMIISLMRIPPSDRPGETAARFHDRSTGNRPGGRLFPDP